MFGGKKDPDVGRERQKSSGLEYDPGSPQASLGKEDENGNDSVESNEEDELKNV